MNIFVLWSVFEEMPHLVAHVDAAHSAIRATGLEPFHVVVDGAYPSFPSDHRLSQDGTREFALEAGLLVDAPVEECAKRTEGLRIIDALADSGDLVLVLDGDEELTSLVPLSSVGVLSFTRDSDKQTYERARLYPWQRGYEFRCHHYDLWLGPQQVASLTAGTTCGRGIHHDRSHDRTRQRAKDSYYRHLSEVEA